MRDRRPRHDRRADEHPAAPRHRGTDARERGRHAPRRRRHGRHVETPAEHRLARRHAADVRRSRVHRRGDQRPRLQPREHRRLRPHRLGRHTGSPDRRRALRRDLRALRPPVHARPATQAPPGGPRHRPRTGLQSQPGGDRSLPGGGVADRRVHPARAGPQLLARAGKDPAAPVQVPHEHQHPDQPTQERRGPRRRARSVG